MSPSPAPMQAASPAAPPWTREVGELLADLGSSARGLSAEQARRRLAEEGPNRFDDAPRVAALRLLLHQFASPLVLILVLAAGVSLFLRDWSDAAIILAVVLGSTLLGFTQEYRASTAVAALRARLALVSRVRRDGVTAALPAQDLVRGDLVPADGVLIEARDLMLSESTLTGESFPVEKRVGLSAANAAPNARENCVFLGTSVRSGSGVMVVTATGGHTEVGDIAALLRRSAAPSEFEHGVAQFGTLLLRVMVVMVLLVLTLNTAQGRAPIEALLFAVALAVGLSPELLPAIVSVTLSHGARAMAAHGVLIRRLESIEDLGSIDILCTDKTGTLTEGRITLEAAVASRAGAGHLERQPRDRHRQPAGPRDRGRRRRGRRRHLDGDQDRRDSLRLRAQAADHRRAASRRVRHP
jgi:P-type Mg2+ transporter